jgi:FMN phosphatase YigB (HAD superfamily)
MKLILDFDDVLMDTFLLKKKIAASLYELGVSKKKADNYYDQRDKSVPFSLKNFLVSFLKKEKIESVSPILLYDKIMSICPEILNHKIIQVAKDAGKENSFIVTNGDKKYQMDKIKKSGVEDFFVEIHITNGSKKEMVENICLRYPNEKVIFVDNKIECFKDLNLERCKNLCTVLYDGHGFENLKKEIEKSKRALSF